MGYKVYRGLIMEKFVTAFDIVYSIIIIGVWFGVSFLTWFNEQDGPVGDAEEVTVVGVVIGIVLLTVSYLGVRILIGPVDEELLKQLPFVFSVTFGSVFGIPLLWNIATYRFDIPFILIFILTASPLILLWYITHFKIIL